MNNGFMFLLGDASDAIKKGASDACHNNCNSVGLGDLFGTLANTLIFLVGAISVIMIILGGLRYAISNGDSKQVTTAKDTILYAVIGLIVSVVSYGVVNFVISALNKSK